MSTCNQRGHTSAIIWDELPFINKAGWGRFDNVCCMICGCPDGPECSFIGLGDFCQADPTVNGAYSRSIKSSTLWEGVAVLTLTTPVRSIDDRASTEFVDKTHQKDGIDRKCYQKLSASMM